MTTKTNEEIMSLYNENEKYVFATAAKRFNNQQLQSQHGITQDEVIQHGRLGLYRACREYSPSKKSTFRTFALNHIYWSMNTESKKESLTRKQGVWSFESTVERLSLDDLVPECNSEDDVATMHDVVADPTASNMFNQLEMDEKFAQLSDVISERVADIVDLRIQGFNNVEIGKKLGVTRQRIDFLLKDNREAIKNIMLA